MFVNKSLLIGDQLLLVTRFCMHQSLYLRASRIQCFVLVNFVIMSRKLWDRHRIDWWLRKFNIFIIFVCHQFWQLNLWRVTVHKPVCEIMQLWVTQVLQKMAQNVFLWKSNPGSLSDKCETKLPKTCDT